jgi:hypothetical protein
MKDKNINEYYEARSDKLLEVQDIIDKYFDTVIADHDELIDVDLLGENGFESPQIEQEILKKLHTIIYKST